MSTKMFDFYQYTGGDIFVLVSWLKAVRVRYIERINERFKKLRRGVDSTELYKLIIDASKMSLRSPFNISAFAAIYLHQDRFYVKFVGVPDELLAGAPLLDMSYWDNTDRPDELSEEEWEARGSLVTTLLEDGRMSRDALIFQFADENDAHKIINWKSSSSEAASP